MGTNWVDYAQVKATARRLPTVGIGRKRFYRDDRLRELRNVENPHDRIPYSTR